MIKTEWKEVEVPFLRIAISLTRRTRPDTGSVKIFVSRFPSKYMIELQYANYQPEVHQNRHLHISHRKGNCGVTWP